MDGQHQIKVEDFGIVTVNVETTSVPMVREQVSAFDRDIPELVPTGNYHRKIYVKIVKLEIEAGGHLENLGYSIEDAVREHFDLDRKYLNSDDTFDLILPQI